MKSKVRWRSWTALVATCIAVAGCGHSSNTEGELAFRTSGLHPDNMVSYPGSEISKPMTPARLHIDEGAEITGEIRHFRVYVSRAGHPSQVDISQAVVAFDRRTGKRLPESDFSHCRVGTIRSTSSADEYYVAPTFPCHDELTVRAVAADGLYREFTVPIEVVRGNNPRRVGLVQPSEPIRVEAPGRQSPARIAKRPVPSGVGPSLVDCRVHGRICSISGSWPGHDGQSIALYVQNQNGDKYPQPACSSVANSHFSGFVYLGDSAGGQSEDFKVWAEGPGGLRGNSVTVHRGVDHEGS